MRAAIKKITSFKARQAKMQNVLDVLKEQGGALESSTGGAAVQLKKLCMDETQAMTQSAFSNILNDMAKGGLLEISRNGKRTNSIALVGGATVPATVPAVPPVLPVADALPADDDTPTADELGARPGRLAARIEKAIPDLVDASVHGAMADIITGFAKSMGLVVGVDEELEQEVHTLRSQVAAMEGTLRNLEFTTRMERIRGDAARQELNTLLRKSNDGFPASKGSLSAHQLPKEYREIGQYALENGWTVQKTRGGGHLVWRSADGEINFSGSTPSDNNSPTLLRMDLERLGLPRNRDLA